jgi:type IV pilus assembly protein PilV
MTTRTALLRAQSGFSLIEVMVSLIIVSVGLLGIAKMQALAYASTGIASKRSIAAIQAASLAASMNANRSYWAAGTAPTNTTVNGLVVASTDGTLAIASDCTQTTGAVPCTPVKVAAYDVQQWAKALQPLLTNDQATIACITAGLPVSPVSCTITITWTENQVAINNQEAAAAKAAAAAGTPAALQLPSYTLYVQP